MMLSDLITAMRDARRRLLTGLQAVPQAALGAPASWRGVKTDIRFLLLRLSHADDERQVALSTAYQARGWAPSEAQQILAQASVARGGLLAVLVGLPDNLLDAIPEPGEWSVRQVLDHCERVDRRYLTQIMYAVRRQRDDPTLPVRIAEDHMPERVGEAPPGESLETVLDRMQALRDEVVAQLATIASDELQAPAVWLEWQIDARFRLHRITAHDREHSNQIIKTLRGIGFTPSETHMLLGQAMVARGALEGLLAGLPDDAPDWPCSSGGSVAGLLRQAAAQDRETLSEVQAAFPK